MKHKPKGRPANQRTRSPAARNKRRLKRLRRGAIGDRQGPAFIARRVQRDEPEGLPYTIEGSVPKPRGLLPWLGRKVDATAAAVTYDDIKKAWEDKGL